MVSTPSESESEPQIVFGAKLTRFTVASDFSSRGCPKIRRTHLCAYKCQVAVRGRCICFRQICICMSVTCEVYCNRQLLIHSINITNGFIDLSPEAALKSRCLHSYKFENHGRCIEHWWDIVKNMLPYLRFQLLNGCTHTHL